MSCGLLVSANGDFKHLKSAVLLRWMTGISWCSFSHGALAHSKYQWTKAASANPILNRSLPQVYSFCLTVWCISSWYFLVLPSRTIESSGKYQSEAHQKETPGMKGIFAGHRAPLLPVSTLQPDMTWCSLCSQNDLAHRKYQFARRAHQRLSLDGQNWASPLSGSQSVALYPPSSEHCLPYDAHCGPFPPRLQTLLAAIWVPVSHIPMHAVFIQKMRLLASPDSSWCSLFMTH